ncbi:MAG: YkvA family protein [Spirosomataceae bacterium]
MPNQEDLITRVLKSIFFKRATQQADRYAHNKSSLLELIRQSLAKSSSLGGDTFKKFQERLLVLGRLLKAYISGEYRVIPWKSLIKIIAGLIYFVSPIDVIPDIIPVLGFTDDVTLILWIFKSIQEDIDDFLAWERGELQSHT